jgi:hypothetical protein
VLLSLSFIPGKIEERDTAKLKITFVLVHNYQSGVKSYQNAQFLRTKLDGTNVVKTLICDKNNPSK